MRIVVAYKWARNPEDAAVRSDGSVDWRGAKLVAGEDDPAALEAALAVAGGAGGTVIGLTIGSGDPSWALARGIEAAVSVPDVPPMLDEAATGRTLASAVRHLGRIDLVVIGDAEPYPGVAPALAAALGWPAVLGVSSATWGDGAVLATRRSGDVEQTVRIGLPAVLGVAAASEEKKVPGMKEQLAARRRPVTTVALAELDTSVDDKIEVRSSRAPDVTGARLFEGDPAAAARELITALRADGVL